jgi:hypothetical protein
MLILARFWRAGLPSCRPAARSLRVWKQPHASGWRPSGGSGGSGGTARLPASAPQREARALRYAAPSMADFVDLTLDDDDDSGPMPAAPPPGAPPPSAAEQRQRIMAFAAAKAKRPRSAGGGSPNAGPGTSPDTRPSKQPAPSRPQPPEDSGVGGGEGGGNAPPGGGGNALLAQLHAERLARAQRAGGGGGGGCSGSASREAVPARAPAADAGARGSGREASPPAPRPSGRGAPSPTRRGTGRPVPPRDGGGGESGGPAAGTQAGGGGEAARAPPQALSLLQYNVWFNEGAALWERMAAVGRIVEEANYPTFITLQARGGRGAGPGARGLCGRAPRRQTWRRQTRRRSRPADLRAGVRRVPLPRPALHPRPTTTITQEVTPNILRLLAASDWWGRYVASPPPGGGDPYFTLLLARADAVGPGVTPRSFRRSPFPASQMGARAGGRGPGRAAGPCGRLRRRLEAAPGVRRPRCRSGSAPTRCPARAPPAPRRPLPANADGARRRRRGRRGHVPPGEPHARHPLHRGAPVPDGQRPRHPRRCARRQRHLCR